MKGRPWLIVDGYNVIGSKRPLDAVSSEELEIERVRLVSRVAAYAADDYRPVVVFDAAGNPYSDGRPHRVAGVAVIFTAPGRSADETIEGLARRARERGESVVVATSDAQTQWTVLGEGALRMSARDLLEELSEREAADRREAGRPSFSRVSLADRLDATTRERLSRWARKDR